MRKFHKAIVRIVTVMLCATLAQLQAQEVIKRPRKTIHLGAEIEPDLSNVKKIYVMPVSLVERAGAVIPLGLLGSKNNKLWEPFVSTVSPKTRGWVFAQQKNITQLLGQLLSLLDEQTLKLFGSKPTWNKRDIYYIGGPESNTPTNLLFFVEVPYIPSALLTGYFSWLNEVYRLQKDLSYKPSMLAGGYQDYAWVRLPELTEINPAWSKPINKFEDRGWVKIAPDFEKLLLSTPGLGVFTPTRMSTAIETIDKMLRLKSMDTWRKEVGAPRSFALATAFINSRVFQEAYEPSVWPMMIPAIPQLRPQTPRQILLVQEGKLAPIAEHLDFVLQKDEGLFAQLMPLMWEHIQVEIQQRKIAKAQQDAFIAKEARRMMQEELAKRAASVSPVVVKPPSVAKPAVSKAAAKKKVMKKKMVTKRKKPVKRKVVKRKKKKKVRKLKRPVRKPRRLKRKPAKRSVKNLKVQRK